MSRGDHLLFDLTNVTYSMFQNRLVNHLKLIFHLDVIGLYSSKSVFLLKAFASVCK